jgi:hypothetical protein
MINGNSQTQAPEPVQRQGIAARGVFWALQCGWIGGCLVGLPVALATGGDYFPTALWCGLGLFVVALVVVVLRIIGGAVGTGLAKLVFALLMIAIFLGFACFVGLKIYFDFCKPSATQQHTTYEGTFEPVVTGN